MSAVTKAPPRDLTHHLSEVTKSRKASELKKFYKYFSIPGIVNLAGGLPHYSYFPYDTLEASVATADRFKHDKNDLSSHSGRITVPKAGAPSLTPLDIATALQYGDAKGYPVLLQWISHFTTTHMHPNIPYAGGADVVLTCGNTDGFNKALLALSNEWSEHLHSVEDRQAILVERFCYMAASSSAVSRGLHVAAVQVDGIGMVAEGPGGLRDVLENWDTSISRRPHLMYTVTVGQNPTGGTMTLARRREIYALCCEYDVIIIEDEPYWFLQYSPQPEKSAEGTSSGYEFLDSLEPSYLSIDNEGRVVRLDTFSKCVAPGCRLGWITAQPAIVERILRITEGSTQQPSGFVQSMIAKLLGADKGDGNQTADGWVRWLEGLRDAYEGRRQVMCEALQKGVDELSVISSDGDAEMKDWSVVSRSSPLFEFDWPTGGMFVWIKVNFAEHPLADLFWIDELAAALWVMLTEEPYLALITPGRFFAPDVESMAASQQCYRLCFAAVSHDELVRSSKGFVQGVADFWKIHDRAEIERLLDDVSGESAEIESADFPVTNVWGC